MDATNRTTGPIIALMASFLIYLAINYLPPAIQNTEGSTLELGSVISQAKMVLMIFMVMQCFVFAFQAMRPALEGHEKQELTLFVPVPIDAAANVLPLLLDPDDRMIYEWTRKRGKTAPVPGGVNVKYRGEPVFNASTNSFRLRGKEYKPVAIKTDCEWSSG